MKILQNTLYITTENVYLRLEGDTVCVMIDKKKVMQAPLHHLSSFVLNETVTMSSSLMGNCADNGRTVVWLDYSGHFKARVEGAVNGNILLRIAQFRIADQAEPALIIAKAIIAGKLKNSRQLLMRAARESQIDNNKHTLSKAADGIAANLRSLAAVTSASTLLGLEGQSASLYFEVLSLVMTESARADFPFTKRTRRPPKDAFNALLSYLYALVLSDCRSALETVGLDPQLGFFHVPRSGRLSLALDLQEEFRAAIADRLALTLINRGQLKPKDFDFREGGAVGLNDKGRRTVIKAYQERKQETLKHPLLEQEVQIGLLPYIQARLLARYLRGDITTYVPYLQA